MNKKTLPILTLTIFIVIYGASCAERNTAAGPVADAKETNVLRTPADEKIEKAKLLVEKYPELSGPHLRLAAAYLQKVRETGDHSLNRVAERSISLVLQKEPQNFDAKVLQAQIFLSEHEFGKALDLGRELDRMRPDNPLAHAVMTDALTELGRYDEAVRTAQKFVDLRPNALSYTRVAQLRSLHGDPEGAIEARGLAVKMADPRDLETYAWYLTQLGTEYFNSGNHEKAGLAFDKALEVLPEYHLALAGRGKVLAAAGKYAAAAEIYERLRRRTPDASRDIFLGDIYSKMGRAEDAARIYREVAERETKDENGDLHRIALLWADHDINPDEALRIAREDREVNNDLLASDTYAWALYKNGKYAEARKQMREAMRLGTRNALFFYHLGMIEHELGNKSEAVRNLELALEINPAFDLLQADVARETLELLRG